MTTTRRVREALARFARADFLPPDQQGFGREDRALRIGYEQTNSQPSTVAAMLDLLEVAPGQRVLDVGSGSGWTTAVLGDLVGPEGEVHGVELVPELVRFGSENVAKYAMPWVRVHQASRGGLGLPELAPFDRILVSAAARTVPESLVQQLTADGLMVIPVSGRMATVRRSGSAAEPVVEHHGHYAFVPLIEPDDAAD